MADTAATVALLARRNEVYRFSMVVDGIDLTGVPMSMQVRRFRGAPGPASIQLDKVDTLAAEGLKLDSVTQINGVPRSVIIGRINKATMSDPAKVPTLGPRGADTPLAYAMRWTLGGDDRTRVEGGFIVRDTAYGSDSAPLNRPIGDGVTPDAAGSGSGSLTFGDQVIHVSVSGVEQLAALIAGLKSDIDAAANAAKAQTAADVIAASDASKASTDGRIGSETARSGSEAARDASKGWAEGPVPTGSERSSKGWAQLSGDRAATAGTYATAAQQAAGQLPSDAILAMQAPTRTILRGFTNMTAGRQAYLAEPGREGMWQWLVGDYSSQIAADPYEALYLKAPAVVATQGAWCRIVENNTYWYCWTGITADTADITPMVRSANKLFPPNSMWVFSGHTHVSNPAGNADPTLVFDKPNVTVIGFGAGATWFDYRGTQQSFVGLGLFQVAASNVIIRQLRISIIAPGNASSNPACIGVTYTRAQLDQTTGPLPELRGTRIIDVVCDRTSLGIVVGAYDRTNRADGGIGKPEDTLIDNFQCSTNGVPFSLFGAGASEVRNYDLRFDASLPAASPSAIQAAGRILGATSPRIGAGKIADFPTGFFVGADVSRIKNRSVHFYGKIDATNIKQILLLAECLGEFRMDGGVVAKRSLANTDDFPAISIIGQQTLGAVDPNLPPEEKISVIEDVVIENVVAEGYAAFASRTGKMGKLTIERNKWVGNANASDQFGLRFAVIERDPFGLPTVTRMNDNDFRGSSSSSTPSVTLGASTGLVEALRNFLPERIDIENSFVVYPGSVVFTDEFEQRPFNSIVNLRTNRVHAIGTLANYRSGTPIPAKAITPAGWARNLVGVTEDAANRFTKTGGGANAYDAAVYSTERLTGDFELTYRLRQLSDDLIVGVTSAYRGPQYGQTDYAIYYTANGNGSLYLRAGFQISQTRSYGTTTIERWRRVGTRLIFSRNGVDTLNLPISSELALGLQASIARMGDAVEILRFAALI